MTKQEAYIRALEIVASEDDCIIDAGGYDEKVNNAILQVCNELRQKADGKRIQMRQRDELRNFKRKYAKICDYNEHLENVINNAIELLKSIYPSETEESLRKTLEYN